MLDTVKRAMHITVTAYDDELQELISAGLADLAMAGVIVTDEDAPCIRQAVATYCRTRFGSPADYDKLKAAYDEQKAQLQGATGYTDWGDST